jgi:hypothetical protein
MYVKVEVHEMSENSRNKGKRKVIAKRFGAMVAILIVTSLVMTFVMSGDGIRTGNANTTTATNENGLAVNTGMVATVTIALSQTTIGRGDSITYTATVTGSGGSSSVPTGTVDIQISLNGGTWASLDTGVVLNGGTFTSELYTPPAMGNYNFRAIYSGDLNYPSSQSDVSETLVVGLASSSPQTYLNTTSIKLGQSVTDSVTIYTLFETFPTGSVDFQVSLNGGAFVNYDTKTLVGGTATSDPYIPSGTGTCYFRAVYGGDNNHAGSQSGDSDEPLIVRALDKQAVMVTTELDFSIPGYTVSQTATVTSASGPVPTGTVTFEIGGDPWFAYTSGDLYQGRTSGNGYAYVGPGHIEFRANYSGDDYYLSGTSAPVTLDVPKASSFTSAMLSNETTTLGSSISVTAEVFAYERFGSGTGTIAFQVSYEGGVFRTYDTRPVGDTFTMTEVTSADYAPPVAGQYKFRALYSGDYDFLCSRSAELPLEVKIASTKTTTCLGVGSIHLGQSVTDNVTVSGVGGGSPFPTGSVDFQVSFNCGAWVVFDAGVVLVNGSAISTWYAPHEVGEYRLQAVYSGEYRYLGSTSCPFSEPLLVKAPPATATDLC